MVHFHFYPIYTVVNYLKLFFNIRIVYTDHMGKKAKKFSKKLLRKIYYFTNSKLFSSGIDKIICVSNFVKSKYSREYGIDSRSYIPFIMALTWRSSKKIQTPKI
ncbi:glycosyltransferase family 4 protein [Methanosarcina mazei]|nr:glycosyltransferase family 4 protein [Methanosarcina mazei]